MKFTFVRYLNMWLFGIRFSFNSKRGDFEVALGKIGFFIRINL